MSDPMWVSISRLGSRWEEQMEVHSSAIRHRPWRCKEPGGQEEWRDGPAPRGSEDAQTNSLVERVIQSRTAAYVERCHTIPHQGSYSVAAHSWGVAMLMLLLWPAKAPRLLPYCLTHDVGEAWVGDVPSHTAKRMGIAGLLATQENAYLQRLNLPHPGSLSREDQRLLRACDLLEFYLWVRDQSALGNRFVDECREQLARYFHDNPLPAPADELYAELEMRTLSETLPRRESW